MANSNSQSGRKKNKKNDQQARRSPHLPDWSTEPDAESDALYEDDAKEECDTANYVQKYRQDQSIKKLQYSSPTSDKDNKHPNNNAPNLDNSKDSMDKRCA